MNKKYLLGLLAIIPIVLLIQSVEAKPSSDLLIEDGKTFKVFEDGITYIEYTNNIFCCGDGGVHYDILYDGVRYTCALDAYHSVQVINPQCIEIILRSLP